MSGLRGGLFLIGPLSHFLSVFFFSFYILLFMFFFLFVNFDEAINLYLTANLFDLIKFSTEKSEQAAP